MPTVTQSRALPYHPIPSWYWANGVLKRFQTDVGGLSLGGSQTTTSYRTLYKGQEQDEKDDRNPTTRLELYRQLRDDHKLAYDSGHEFSTEKYEQDCAPSEDVIIRQAGSGGKDQRTYRGPFLPGVAFLGSSSLSVGMPTALQINADGAKAINRTIPTAPEAGLAQFVGELREKLPSLIGYHSLKNSQESFTGKLGAEHLNLEFGIKPMISDVTSMASSVLHAHKLIAQYRKNSGEIVRRKTTLRDDMTAQILTENAITANPFISSYADAGDFFSYDSFMASGGRLTSVKTTESIVKFSGAFTYHLAEAHDMLSKLEMYEQLANHLLGTRITPSTIWELTPWSWLFDWFADIGTLLSNLSLLSADSSVVRYGYIMHENRVTVEHIFKGYQLKPGWSAPSLVSKKETYVRKTRTRATPYGFGVNLGALTPRRWAILAALGFTKSDNQLRRSG